MRKGVRGMFYLRFRLVGAYKLVRDFEPLQAHMLARELWVAREFRLARESSLVEAYKLVGAYKLVRDFELLRAYMLARES